MTIRSTDAVHISEVILGHNAGVLKTWYLSGERLNQYIIKNIKTSSITKSWDKSTNQVWILTCTMFFEMYLNVVLYTAVPFRKCWKKYYRIKHIKMTIIIMWGFTVYSASRQHQITEIQQTFPMSYGLCVTKTK